MPFAGIVQQSEALPADAHGYVLESLLSGKLHSGAPLASRLIPPPPILQISATHPTLQANWSLTPITEPDRH
jgi:hypothetical protein